MNYPTYEKPDREPYTKDPFDWHCAVCGVGFRTKTNAGYAPGHYNGPGKEYCPGTNKPPAEAYEHVRKLADFDLPSQKQLLDMMDPADAHEKMMTVTGNPPASSITDRQHFETGAVRDNDKEARYDLVPPGPFRKLAVHYGRGAKKYAERNWEKGIPFMRMYASLMRHTQAWVSGEDIDQDETMQNPEHLVAALWNLVGLIELSQTHPELDDRPKK